MIALLKNLSVIPYRKVTIETGLIMEHFKNGRIRANKRVIKKYGNKK